MKDADNGWLAFKERLGNGDFAAGVQAVERAIALLRKRYGADLRSLVLFGSFARGSAHYDDIDLLIISGESIGSIHEVTRSLAQEIFGPLFLDYGQLFSFLLYSKVQLDEMRDFLPLISEIAREGILLHGQDLFATVH